MDGVRMHGGTSTGPRTPEGLARSKRAAWKHGRYSAETLAARREAQDDTRARARCRAMNVGAALFVAALILMIISLFGVR
jgi:hypothetical protein